MTGPVRLRSELLDVVVQPEGARISSIRWVPTDRELLLTTPWADAAADRWSMTASNAEWHRRYPGGWHTLVPRAGEPVEVDGAEQPFHGEAAWRVWDISAGVDGCTTSVDLRSVPIRLERRVAVIGAAVHVTQRVTCTSPQTVRIGWVEHPAFDGALFAPGDRVDFGTSTVPLVDRPGASFDDVEAAGRASIDARAAGLRLTLGWDARLFPRAYVWQEREGSDGFPWWRSVDAVGIEPASQPYDSPASSLGPLVVRPGAPVEAEMVLTVAQRADS